MTPDHREEEWFHYFANRFDVRLANVVAVANYKPETETPTDQWVGSFTDVDPAYAMTTDITKPVVFATLFLEDKSYRLLIDGNHRVTRALAESADVPTYTLSLADTYAVMETRPTSFVNRLVREAKKAGALPADYNRASRRKSLYALLAPKSKRRPA